MYSEYYNMRIPKKDGRSIIIIIIIPQRVNFGLGCLARGVDGEFTSDDESIYKYNTLAIVVSRRR